MSLRTKTTLAK
jgi:hypothetical protein